MNRIFLCFFISATLSAIERPITIVIASYNNQSWYKKNLDSVFSQKYSNYRAIYIDDCSTDGTGDLVEKYIKEKNKSDKIILIRNKKRYGSLANRYRAIHSCNDNEIIAILDGDDWFATNQVLKKINEEYSDPNVWLTYGSFYFLSSNLKPKLESIPDSVIEQNSFRSYRWFFSHLRTFYAWLFKQIKLKDLFHQGSMFTSSTDMATMFPMVEMARYHTKTISDTLYCYNDKNNLNLKKLIFTKQKNNERIIREKKKYKSFRAINKNKHLGSNVIIYSNNPIRLILCLNSLLKFLKNFNSIKVIYQASSKTINKNYKEIKDMFPYISFYPLEKNPEEMSIKLMDNKYTLFATDKIIISSILDLNKYINLLETIKAHYYFFHLNKENLQNFILEEPFLTYKVPINLDASLYAWQINYNHKPWLNINKPYLILAKKTSFVKSLEYKLKINIGIFSNKNILEDKK